MNNKIKKVQPTSRRPPGRPRIHPEGHTRHFLSVERDESLDADLVQAQEVIAQMRGLPASAISQAEVVKRALRLLAATSVTDPNPRECPCCNGTGRTI